jgi:hypothetical protein
MYKVNWRGSRYRTAETVARVSYCSARGVSKVDFEPKGHMPSTHLPAACPRTTAFKPVNVIQPESLRNAIADNLTFVGEKAQSIDIQLQARHRVQQHW